MAISRAFRTLIILLIIVAVIAADDRPFVTTPTAKIYGKWVDLTSRQVPEMQQKMAVYSRIPYVEPPVGDLRFKAPVPKVLTGDFDATRPGIACPQVVVDFLPIGLNQSEDCLYLDVFVPAKKASPAAVMVWIHGGGFTMGAGSIPTMLPNSLAAIGEVIVVTINYRLNVLGFLSTGDEEIPDNMGFLDQRQALVWVQENIAAFGGDPNRVTIFGESAGSGSANFHLLSPMSSGLFHRAILQSGAVSQPLWYVGREQAAPEAFAFGQRLGCDSETSIDLATCLRGKPIEDIVEDLEIMSKESPESSAKPVVGGSFLPDDPVAQMTAGSFNPAEVINGYLSNEGSVMLAMLGSAMGAEVGSMNQTTFYGLISGFLRLTDPLLVESTAFVYTDPSKIGDPEAEYSDASSNFFGDTLFACSANALTRNLAKAGRSVYFYVMTHTPSTSIWGQHFSNLGATHGEDIPYVFGSSLVDSAIEEEFQYSFNDKEVTMSLEIMRYWSNFAKTGDPNRSSQESEETSTGGYPSWPKSTELDPTYKEFSPTFANGKGYPRAKECFYWEKVFPSLMQASMELAGLKSTLEEKVEADSGKSCNDPESCPEN